MAPPETSEDLTEIRHWHGAFVPQPNIPEKIRRWKLEKEWDLFAKSQASPVASERKCSVHILGRGVGLLARETIGNSWKHMDSMSIGMS